MFEPGDTQDSSCGILEEKQGRCSMEKAKVVVRAAINVGKFEPSEETLETIRGAVMGAFVRSLKEPCDNSKPSKWPFDPIKQ